MKYFFDTEFSEGFKKPIKWLPTIGRFNKRYHSIELISIGVICEDGRTYYAISNEFNPDDASDWVKKNVLLKIIKSYHGDQRNMVLGWSLKQALRVNGKTNYQIACDIMQFTMDWDGKGLDKWLGFTDDYFEALRKSGSNLESPEFYAYYADYDWVLFCSLFGSMNDLPKDFPMYCIDLKQMLDEKLSQRFNSFTESKEMTLAEKLVVIKKHTEYPQQANEHNALDDAKWNFELYKFLKNI